jgi:hypothetical protein
MLLVILEGRFNCYCPIFYFVLDSSDLYPWLQKQFSGFMKQGTFCPWSKHASFPDSSRIEYLAESSIFYVNPGLRIEEALARAANSFTNQATFIAAGTS